jgi:hypothetical protein
MKKAAEDHFERHEIGNYSAIVSEPATVIGFLCRAGEDFYKNWQNS